MITGASAPSSMNCAKASRRSPKVLRARRTSGPAVYATVSRKDCHSPRAPSTRRGSTSRWQRKASLRLGASPDCRPSLLCVPALCFSGLLDPPLLAPSLCQGQSQFRCPQIPPCINNSKTNKLYLDDKRSCVRSQRSMTMFCFGTFCFGNADTSDAPHGGANSNDYSNDYEPKHRQTQTTRTTGTRMSLTPNSLFSSSSMVAKEKDKKTTKKQKKMKRDEENTKRSMGEEKRKRRKEKERKGRKQNNCSIEAARLNQLDTGNEGPRNRYPITQSHTETNPNRHSAGISENFTLNVSVLRWSRSKRKNRASHVHITNSPMFSVPSVSTCFHRSLVGNSTAVSSLEPSLDAPLPGFCSSNMLMVSRQHLMFSRISFRYRGSVGVEMVRVSLSNLVDASAKVFDKCLRTPFLCDYCYVLRVQSRSEPNKTEKHECVHFGCICLSCLFHCIVHEVLVINRICGVYLSALPSLLEASQICATLLSLLSAVFLVVDTRLAFFPPRHTLSSSS